MKNTVLLTGIYNFSDFVEGPMQQPNLYTQYNMCTLPKITLAEYY